MGRMTQISHAHALGFDYEILVVGCTTHPNARTGRSLTKATRSRAYGGINNFNIVKVEIIHTLTRVRWDHNDHNLYLITIIR